MKISTSIIAPDGTRVVQSSFEGFDCPSEWIIALKAMAAAAKSAHSANSVATSSSAPAPPSNEQDSGHPRPSPAHHAGRKNRTLTTRSSQKKPNDLQKSKSSGEGTDNRSSYNAHEPDELASDRPQSSQELSNHVHNNEIFPSDPVTETGSQHPAGVLRQPSNISSNQPFVPLAAAGNTPSSSIRHDHLPTLPNQCSIIRRTQKLEAQLEAIRDNCVPLRDELNDTVRQLYQHSRASPQSVTSMEQFGHVLGRLGNTSSTVGIIYSLLCWQIFRWEEERLVREEGRALLVAAKCVR